MSRPTYAERQWSVEAIGPTGQIVRVDPDAPVVGPFDVVHARAVLAHRDDRGRLLSQLAASLRPGGLLVVEDFDPVTLVAADPAHPASGAFDRVVGESTRLAEARPGGHPSFARGLVPFVRGCGLGEVTHEATATLCWGGSAEAERLRQSFAALHGRLLEHGRLGAGDIAAWHAALSDPGFCFYGPLNIVVRARRPG